jgi:hypothetical protein
MQVEGLNSEFDNKETIPNESLNSLIATMQKDMQSIKSCLVQSATKHNPLSMSASNKEEQDI